MKLAGRIPDPPGSGESPPGVAAPSIPRRRLWRAAVVVPVLVLTIATGLRVWRLGFPAGTYWDENYYALDAAAYLGGGFGATHPDDPAVKIENEGTWVHPPLGKWMIAFGIGPLGDRPFGWRLPSAVFGVAGVLLLYLLALELWGSVWWAGLAALLLAVDGLHVVQSRIAMLDIFLTTFVTAGTLCLVWDRRRTSDGEGSERSHLWRWFGNPYRLGAGVMFGAAVATKWSGAFALVPVGVLSMWWLILRARRLGRPAWPEARTVLACYGLVPLVVYLASYTTFFVQHGPALRDFLALQKAMFEHQVHHASVQPENSAAWTWPLLLHPIRYYAARPAVGATPRILALGNPVLWWAFLAATPLLVAGVLKDRDWRDAVVVGGFAAMFAPWLLLGRTQYIYYMLPAVPFMCLGLVRALRTLPPRWRLRASVTVGAGASLAAAAYAPLWLGASAPWLSGLPRLGSWA